MKLKLYQGAKEIDELAPLWFSLAESLGATSISQYPEIYQSYIKTFITETNHFFVAAIFDNGDLVAIFPLRMTHNRTRGIKYEVLRFPQLPLRVYDVLVSPMVSKIDIFSCLSDGLANQIGFNWDYMKLSGVLESSDLIKFVDSKLFQSCTIQVRNSHLLDVTQGDYLKNVLGRSTRQTLRKKRRKLAEHVEWGYRTIDTYPGLKEAFKSFLDIEASGWKSVRGGKRAIKLHKNKTAFYQNLMQRNAPMGRCHIHLLEVNRKPIAANFCILTGNTCYSLKIGYNEQFADLSPGNLLFAYTVEYYSDSKSIETMNLISDSRWHFRWRPQCRQIHEVVVFNRTARGVFKYWTRRLKSLMTRSKTK